jgi:hypothetical protein
MTKFQRRALTGLVLLSMSSIVAACSPARLFPILNSHPAAVVGEWVDSAKTQPRDTSLWVLGPSGEDESRHIVVQPNGAIATSPRQHYGFWYLDGRVSDPANRFLCFSKRPGRSAPTCLAFDLDTVATSGGARRRLIVHAYQGRHTTSDRVLFARAP